MPKTTTRYCAWCREPFESADEDERHCSFDCAELDRTENCGEVNLPLD